MKIFNGLKGRGLRKRLHYALNPRYWYINPIYWNVNVEVKLVYILSMPRTGSTLMKRFMGEYPYFIFASSSDAYDVSKNINSGKKAIIKDTNNITNAWWIFRKYGRSAAFTILIRDPRDELVSLIETERHAEVPKDFRFWKFWFSRYSNLFDFAKKYAAKGINISFVRYEDLVQRPVKVKKRFLQWLGYSENVDALTAKYHNVISEIAKGKNDSEDWKTHNQNQVHTKSIGRWKKIQNEKITYYKKLPEVEDFMQKLGYGEVLSDFKYDLGNVVLIE